MGLSFREGAGVGPVLRLETELGFDGIVPDVSDGVGIVIEIADVSVVVFAFPDGA